MKVGLSLSYHSHENLLDNDQRKLLSHAVFIQYHYHAQ